MKKNNEEKVEFYQITKEDQYRSVAAINILLSQRESFVTVKIFESKILMNFDVFEVPESE